MNAAQKGPKRLANNSLQPTPVERLGSAFAVDIIGPASLSLVRSVESYCS